MLFMVIERFRNRDPKPIYRRLRDEGRHMPDGLKYVDSRIELSFERCFQLMECADPKLFQQWIAAWGDLMEFEIVPVVLIGANPRGDCAVPLSSSRQLPCRRENRRAAHLTDMGDRSSSLLERTAHGMSCSF